MPEIWKRRQGPLQHHPGLRETPRPTPAGVRAAPHLNVDIEAEQEIELVLTHLEYQNGILIEMLETSNPRAGEVSVKGRSRG